MYIFDVVVFSIGFDLYLVFKIYENIFNCFLVKGKEEINIFYNNSKKKDFFII